MKFASPMTPAPGRAKRFVPVESYFALSLDNSRYGFLVANANKLERTRCFSSNSVQFRYACSDMLASINRCSVKAARTSHFARFVQFSRAKRFLQRQVIIQSDRLENEKQASILTCNIKKEIFRDTSL